MYLKNKLILALMFVLFITVSFAEQLAPVSDNSLENDQVYINVGVTYNLAESKPKVDVNTLESGTTHVGVEVIGNFSTMISGLRLNNSTLNLQSVTATAGFPGGVFTNVTVLRKLLGTIFYTLYGGNVSADVIGDLTNTQFLADVQHPLQLVGGNGGVTIAGVINPKQRLRRFLIGGITLRDGSFVTIDNLVLHVFNQLQATTANEVFEDFDIRGHIIGDIVFERATHEGQANEYRDFEIRNFTESRVVNKSMVYFPDTTTNITRGRLINTTIAVPSTANITDIQLINNAQINLYDLHNMRIIHVGIADRNPASANFTTRIDTLTYTNGSRSKPSLLINGIRRKIRFTPIDPVPSEVVDIEANVAVTLQNLNPAGEGTSNGAPALLPTVNVTGGPIVKFATSTFGNVNAQLIVDGGHALFAAYASILQNDAKFNFLPKSGFISTLNQSGDNSVDVVIATTRISNGITIHNKTGGNFKSIRNVVNGDVQVLTN